MVRQQNGFSVVAVVIAAAVLLLVGVTGQLIYSRQKSNNATPAPKSTQPAEEPVTISQGVKGTITILTGDCMPIIDQANTTCKEGVYTTPTTVVIKKPLDINNKENKGVVTKIENVKGTFQARLDPGLYNMYVMYQGKEYCNLFGGQRGEDCEFRVAANQVTEYTLRINAATH